MHARSASNIELLTIGRVSVDLFAEQVATPIRDVTSFRKSIGGTTTNVAIAAARLGRHAATCTRVGDDALGRYIRWALEHTFGVDTRFVGVDPDHQTALAFAELDPPDDPTIIFYREPRAPDMNVTADDVDLDLVATVPILWIAGSNVAFEPMRTAMHDIVRHRRRAAHTVLDLDWRPMFWASPSDATVALDALVDASTMVVGNRAECAVAVGTDDADDAADRLLARGVEHVVVKLGAEGVLVASADGTRERIDPLPVDVVCGLGAGDAFGGALCHGLLAGWDLARCAKLGNAAGAIVASRLMCADAMPTLAEVEAFMASRSNTEQR